MENSLARPGRSFPHRGIHSALALGTERLPATHPVRYTITRLEHPLDWPVLDRPQLAAFEVAAEASIPPAARAS